MPPGFLHAWQRLINIWALLLCAHGVSPAGSHGTNVPPHSRVHLKLSWGLVVPGWHGASGHRQTARWPPFGRVAVQVVYFQLLPCIFGLRPFSWH